MGYKMNVPDWGGNSHAAEMVRKAEEKNWAGRTICFIWTPCPECCRKIVKAKLGALCRIPTGDHDESDAILRDGGVEIIDIVDLDDIEFPPLNRHGRKWSPDENSFDQQSNVQDSDANTEMV